MGWSFFYEVYRGGDGRYRWRLKYGAKTLKESDGAYENKKHLTTLLGFHPYEEPSEDVIRRLAYTTWEDEGKPHGRDLAHWVEAERILEEFEKEWGLVAAAGNRNANAMRKYFRMVRERIADVLRKFRRMVRERSSRGLIVDETGDP